MDFQAILELHGKTATGITIPPEVVESLGSGQRPAVVVTINGYSYRSTVAPYNGVFLLPVSAENRAGAGATAGDLLAVHLDLDTAPREVEVPADLAAALSAAPVAKAFFETLSFSNQRGYTIWIEDAKKQETRDARVLKAIEALEAGRKTH